MTPDQFEEKWKEVNGIIWPLAVSLFMTHPSKVDDDDDPDIGARNARHYKRGQEKWQSTCNIHSQVYQLMGKHGLQLSDYPSREVLHYTEPTELRDWWKRVAYYETVEDPTLQAKAVEPGYMPLIRVNAPAWFKDKKFIEWLNYERTATWHVSGEEPSDYSDVWFTFCQGEGSDSPPAGDDDTRPGVPQRIWDYLTYLIDKEYGGDAEVLVWVSNLE